MWCKQCGQDVPGSATSRAGRFLCPRCGGILAIEAAAPAVYDGWEMDEQLRHIERLLTGGNARADQSGTDA